jgi:hypothetical protein
MEDSSTDSSVTVETTAIVSILISALSVGVTSGMISFDYDVNPKNRLESPTFYGYIPDDTFSRTAIFIVMVLLSSGTLLIRSVNAALLIIAGGGGMAYLLWAFTAEMGLYLLYKLARNDAHYWMPVYGVMGLFASFMGRFIVKFITDYTGSIQFRASVDLGGMYWSANNVVSMVTVYVALAMYYAVKGKAGDNVFMERKEALAWLSAAVVVAGVLFTCFLSLMKSEYRQTFFSTETGSQNSKNYFLQGETDEHKVKILTNNRKQWEDIRGQVGDFTKANWAKWEQQEPAWFDEMFKASVDDDLLPAEALRAMMLDGGAERRRASLAEMMGIADGSEETGGGGGGGGGVALSAISGNNKIAPEELLV